MNEEKYTQLLEDGELFSYINDLQQRIDKAIELVENVYNSLENVDRPIMFYENILEILKGDSYKMNKNFVPFYMLYVPSNCINECTHFLFDDYDKMYKFAKNFEDDEYYTYFLEEDEHHEVKNEDYEKCY